MWNILKIKIFILQIFICTKTDLELQLLFDTCYKAIDGTVAYNIYLAIYIIKYVIYIIYIYIIDR